MARRRKDLTPNPSPKERGKQASRKKHGYMLSETGEWIKSLAFARQNRGKPTEAERTMWGVLRNRQLLGYKFRRQYPIDHYIPDFVCIDLCLVVEIDGGYHEEEARQTLDQLRTEYLHSRGFEVVRFTNEQVLHHLEHVINRLTHIIEKRALLPLSLGEGAGG